MTVKKCPTFKFDSDLLCVEPAERVNRTEEQFFPDCGGGSASSRMVAAAEAYPRLTCRGRAQRLQFPTLGRVILLQPTDMGYYLIA